MAARRTFLSIYRRYERRVTSRAKALGMPRENLVLSPSDLYQLFNMRRLTFLKETRLKPLRALAHRLFAAGDGELLDLYCSHIYHELSILHEEHRSVGRFVHIKDRRRYRKLYEEVSGYYPRRLKRIRRLFTGSVKRIENLLPKWAEHRVIKRSMYLFGDKLAKHAGEPGLAALYVRMYPAGGEIEGYLEASRSFVESGFVTRAREAVQEGVDASDRLRARRPLTPVEEQAVADVRALLIQLDEEAGIDLSA